MGYGESGDGDDDGGGGGGCDVDGEPLDCGGRAAASAAAHARGDGGVDTTPAASPATAASPAFPNQRAATLALLRRLRIAHVASDDLAAEYTPRDAAGQLLEPDGSGRLAICDALTHPGVAYVQLHRREGRDRLLPACTVEDWVHRLRRMACSPLAGDAGGASEGGGGAAIRWWIERAGEVCA